MIPEPILFTLIFIGYLLFLLGCGQFLNRVYLEEAPQEVRIDIVRRRRKRREALNRLKAAVTRWLHQ